MTQQAPRLWALAALTLVLIGLCLLLAKPFLPAITWAVAIAILAWPMHRRMRRIVPWPWLAALFTTAIVSAAIVAVGAFVAFEVVQEITDMAKWSHEQLADPQLNQRLSHLPAYGTIKGWIDKLDINMQQELTDFVKSHSGDVVGVAQGSLGALVQFLIAVFLMYYLFLDPPYFIDRLRDLAPMSKANADQVMNHAGDSIHANLYANAITSLIDAIGGALMFWALGLPAPALWGTVIFIFSFLPAVGGGLIWGTAVLFLALSSRWTAAGLLLGWGLTTAVLIDNVLYFRLAGQRMQMHPVVALLAIMGGIAIFGVTGMILGPAIVAVTGPVLAVWRQGRQQRADAKDFAHELEN